MASADEYAKWIVANADKKGTSDFDTVVQAYQQAKQEEVTTSPTKPAAAPATTPPATQPYQRQPIEFSADPEASAFGQWAFENPKEATRRLATAATSLGGPFVYAAGQAIQKPDREGTWGEAAQEAAKDIGLGYAYNALGKIVAVPVNYLIRKVPGVLASKFASPSIEKLKEASTAARTEMYGAGRTFDPNQLKVEIQQALETSQPRFPVTGSTEATGTQDALKVLDNIISEHNQGTRITKIDELDTLRRQLSSVANRGGTDGKYALEAIKTLDKFVDEAGGDAAAAWKKARALETKQFKSQDIQDIVSNAVKSDSPTSKEIRKKFSNIVADKDQMKIYTSEQQKIIKEIASGTLTEKSLEILGRMTPKSISWQSLLSLISGAGAGAIIGGGAAGAVPGAIATGIGIGVGKTAGGAANALARMRVNQLDELIRAGKLPYQLSDKYGAAAVNYLLNPQLQGQQ